jgi:DNA repair protein RadA/Sms
MRSIVFVHLPRNLVQKIRANSIPLQNRCDLLHIPIQINTFAFLQQRYMAKVQSTFFCQNCGAQASKWIGKCPACGQWNTYVEEVIHKEKDALKKWDGEKKTKATAPVLLDEVNYSEEHRLVTSDKEFNRVLGGGIVPGSVVLIGGEPGIGKSTLLLQIALNFTQGKVLYISGEESDSQVKMRAERIKSKGSKCYILTETVTQRMFKQIRELEPNLLIVDSIQTLQSEYIDSTPGSISQIRECAGELLKYAKESGTPVFLIGHITKDGNIAGPKILEHMVDTVLQFEGDRHHIYRILRTTKNRFGSTAEIGIYEMQGNGLREVSNPSEILISQREEALSGISISAAIEGQRPLLIETQALVSAAVYGNPQRTSNGYDTKRLNMLLAVLEKKAGLRLSAQDVFVNIAGGLRIEDPAIDLGVVASIVSSFHDIPVNPKNMFYW